MTRSLRDLDHDPAATVDDAGPLTRCRSRGRDLLLGLPGDSSVVSRRVKELIEAEETSG
tara:strand:+ start:566 stop:742 length:177 start_codon:yes stop_codon:yes gene_type:complete